MKNAVIAVLVLTVVGLGIYVIKLKQACEPEPVPGPVSDADMLEPVSPEPPPVAPKPEPEMPPVDEAFEAELEEKEEVLGKAHDLIGALLDENQALQEENQVLEEETQPSLAKGIQQIVESPEMQNFVRTGIAREVKRTHTGLYRWLDLTPEQETAVTDLLIEQNLQSIGTGIQWMSGNIEESAAQTVAAREALHAEIGKILGPEKLEVYRYWEASKNERESVQRFNRRLGDNSLDEDSSDQLVGIMYETRGEFEELDYLSQPENFDPRDMTSERRENIMGQVEQLHVRYVEEATPVLTPEQLTEYEANLNRDRKGLNDILTFTHGMFNPGEQPAETPQLPNQP